MRLLCLIIGMAAVLSRLLPALARGDVAEIVGIVLVGAVVWSLCVSGWESDPGE